MQRIASVPFFLSGTPAGDELTTLLYPGMLGMTTEVNIGTAAAPNIAVVQLVLAAAGITPLLGGVCIWSDKTVWTITDVVTNRGLQAGISSRLNAAAAKYFWMYKQGDVSVRFIDSPTSAPATTGNPAVVSTTTAKADALALTTAPLSGWLGNCTSAADGTTHLGTVRLNIPTWM